MSTEHIPPSRRGASCAMPCHAMPMLNERPFSVCLPTLALPIRLFPPRISKAAAWLVSARSTSRIPLRGGGSCSPFPLSTVAAAGRSGGEGTDELLTYRSAEEVGWVAGWRLFPFPPRPALYARASISGDEWKGRRCRESRWMCAQFRRMHALTFFMPEVASVSQGWAC